MQKHGHTPGSCRFTTGSRLCTPRAPAAARDTLELIGELLAVRTLQDPATVLPMPLSAPWLASLNGSDETTVRAGKRWLERRGVIRHVGDAPGRFGRATKLWAVQHDRPTGK
jgi:hypothetical protein